MEQVNQTIEQYIRTYTNFEQTDWYEMLPMAEYAYNNSVTTITKQSHVYSNYGFQPMTTCPTSHEAKNPTSRHYIHRMVGVHAWCQQALERFRERMSKYYDRKKKPALQFKV